MEDDDVAQPPLTKRSRREVAPLPPSPPPPPRPAKPTKRRTAQQSRPAKTEEEDAAVEDKDADEVIAKLSEVLGKFQAQFGSHPEFISQFHKARAAASVTHMAGCGVGGIVPTLLPMVPTQEDDDFVPAAASQASIASSEWAAMGAVTRGSGLPPPPASRLPATSMSDPFATANKPSHAGRPLSRGGSFLWNNSLMASTISAQPYQVDMVSDMAAPLPSASSATAAPPDAKMP